MTYCVGILLDAGIVFASDSRTNAGIDQVSSFSKMRIFERPGDRYISILSSGNLSITQNAINLLDQKSRQNGGNPNPEENFWAARSMFDVAHLLGECLREILKRDGPYLAQNNIDASASFILGGQIAGEHMRLFLVYAAGNFIDGNPALAGVQTVPITTDPLEVAKLTRLPLANLVDTSYGDLYPSVNATVSLRENLLLRLGYAHTIGRPTLAQLIPEHLDRARRESSRDDLAKVGVMRGIHVEQDEFAALDLIAHGALFVPRQGRLGHAGEHVTAPRDLLDVCVFRDDPVAAVVESADAEWLLIPPDRR